MYHKAVLIFIWILFSLWWGFSYSCWDISLADDGYIEFKMVKEFGRASVSRIDAIYNYIVSQSEKGGSNYDYQIAFVGEIMNSLEKKWCYLDQDNLDGNPYLVWKKLTYQLLWLKLDAYLYRLNIQKFQSLLGIKG